MRCSRQQPEDPTQPEQHAQAGDLRHWGGLRVASPGIAAYFMGTNTLLLAMPLLITRSSWLPLDNDDGKVTLIW